MYQFFFQNMSKTNESIPVVKDVIMETIDGISSDTSQGPPPVPSSSPATGGGGTPTGVPPPGLQGPGPVPNATPENANFAALILQTMSKGMIDMKKAFSDDIKNQVNTLRTDLIKQVDSQVAACMYSVTNNYVDYDNYAYDEMEQDNSGQYYDQGEQGREPAAVGTATGAATGAANYGPLYNQPAVAGTNTNAQGNGSNVQLDKQSNTGDDQTEQHEQGHHDDPDRDQSQSPGLEVTGVENSRAMATNLAHIVLDYLPVPTWGQWRDSQDVCRPTLVRDLPDPSTQEYVNILFNHYGGYYRDGRPESIELFSFRLKLASEVGFAPDWALNHKRTNLDVLEDLMISYKRQGDKKLQILDNLYYHQRNQTWSHGSRGGPSNRRGRGGGIRYGRY